MHEAKFGCGTINKKKTVPIARLYYLDQGKGASFDQRKMHYVVFDCKSKILRKQFIFLLQTCCQYNDESNEACDVASSIHGCSIQIYYTRVFGLNQAIFQLHKLLHYFHLLFTILFLLFIFVLSNRPISLDSIQFLRISHFTFLFGCSFGSFFGKHFPSISFLCLL